jgi:hypothetical protein
MSATRSPAESDALDAFEQVLARGGCPNPVRALEQRLNAWLRERVPNEIRKRLLLGKLRIHDALEFARRALRTPCATEF